MSLQFAKHPDLEQPLKEVIVTRIKYAAVTPLVFLLALCLCGLPQWVEAQSLASTPSPPQSAPQEERETPLQAAPPGVVNPAQGTLQPGSPSGGAASVPPVEAPPPAQTTSTSSRGERPVGAAVGQSGTAAGGPASRPAGVAIAPAKQRQTRALLIKVGALAAAGVAVGTVLALSRGTPSTPPGAK